MTHPERAKSVQRLDLAVRILVATATLLTVVLTAWFIRRDASANASTLDTSVIVFPFNNSSRDATQESFATEFTDQLAGRLSVVGLRVTARDTAFAFKGKNLSAKALGKAVNVATVLSGDLRTVGDQVHVTAALSNASNDAVLLTFERDGRVADIVAIQRQLVDSIMSRFGMPPASAPSKAKNP